MLWRSSRTPRPPGRVAADRRASVVDACRPARGCHGSGSCARSPRAHQSHTRTHRRAKSEGPRTGRGRILWCARGGISSPDELMTRGLLAIRRLRSFVALNLYTSLGVVLFPPTRATQEKPRFIFRPGASFFCTPLLPVLNSPDAILRLCRSAARATSPTDRAIVGNAATSRALRRSPSLDGVMQGGLDKRFAHRDFVHLAAKRAVDRKLFRPRGAEALDIRIEARRRSPAGLGASEHELRHCTLHPQAGAVKGRLTLDAQ
jgi:hypothetical protein